MQKLIVLGASRGTLQLIETAQDMGIYSILVGPEGHSRSLDSFGADEVWTFDTTDIDGIVARAQEEDVAGGGYSYRYQSIQHWQCADDCR